MSRAERHAKFRRLESAALEAARIEKIIALVESLDEAEGTERLVHPLQASP